MTKGRDDEILRLFGETPETARLDDLHRGGLRLLQDPSCFCFGCDAVLLSAFARARAGESALDLCSGSGVVPVLMTAKTEAGRFAAVEILPRQAELLRKNIALNGLSEKMTATEGDVKYLSEYVEKSSFDVVTANPPYIRAGSGVKNPDENRAAARHETRLTLPELLAGAAYALRERGRLYMIHRPGRLPEVMAELAARGLSPRKLRMVQPKLHKKPAMFLIEAVKGGGDGLTVLPALIIHNGDGSYTDEVYDIYYN
ncbi:MAG: tRNA1(Val) (adenine(37)-N6)-methyltransferase [Clostridiales bacterium]|jgi:tRNA1Val (adenine37-N6)-methyltransferase|nr:tRNA1(Val) (adenine(37)-N6)-methyltransferase [Clostridiales bacterium]